MLGEGDGCKSGDRGSGSGGAVSMVEVVNGRGMTVGGGGAGNRRDAV